MKIIHATLYRTLAGFLALLPTLGWAADQALPEIRSTVQTFLEQRAQGATGTVQVTVDRLDRRLRLPDCAQALEPFAVNRDRNAGNITVGVRCDGAKPWTIYVPARVSVHRAIAVAARTLARGTIIGPQDLRFEARDIARYHRGYYLDASALLGMQITRNTTEGTALAPALLARTAVVRRGARVVLLGSIPGMEIRAAGEALADAARGDTVRVRNLESKRVVEGVVIEPGLVKVFL